MATIKNTSQAVRVINAKVDGKVKAVVIEPGASVDAEAIKTKAFDGAVEAGHLTIGAAKSEAKADDKK